MGHAGTGRGWVTGYSCLVDCLMTAMVQPRVPETWTHHGHLSPSLFPLFPGLRTWGLSKATRPPHQKDLAQDTPRPSSQHTGDLLTPEGPRAENKRQRREIEDEGEREENKGKGEGILAPEGPRIPLDREEEDKAHRQMAVYTGKRGKPVLG